MHSFVIGLVGSMIGAGALVSVLLLFGLRDEYLWVCIDPEEGLKITKFIAIMNTDEKEVYTDIHTIQEEISKDEYHYVSDLMIKSKEELSDFEGMHFICDYLGMLDGREDVPDWVKKEKWDRVLVEEVPLKRQFG